MGASLALIWTNNRHATGPRKEARDHSQQVLACPTDFGPHSADSLIRFLASYEHESEVQIRVSVSHVWA